MTILQLTEQAEVPIRLYPGLKEQLLRRIEGTGGTGQFIADVRLMGMRYDAPYARFTMSHYAGTDWIDKRRKMAMVVHPKVKGIDIQKMLMQIFRHSETSQNLDEILHIRTEDEPVQTTDTDFQLEPLLIVFFLNLIQRIVRKGLKSDYIQREDQLTGTVKGKIQISRYITNGIAKGRQDKINCHFEEYGVNCLENRVLKQALLLVRDVLLRNQQGLGDQASILYSIYSCCITAFSGVSSQVSLQDLRRVHVHPSYKDYRAIIPLARMIICKQGTQMFPPFIIDMHALYRRYAHSLLLESDSTIPVELTRKTITYNQIHVQVPIRA